MQADPESDGQLYLRLQPSNVTWQQNKSFLLGGLSAEAQDNMFNQDLFMNADSNERGKICVK